MSSIAPGQEVGTNLAPPAVTMHLSSVHPRDAITDFIKQTGADLHIEPENLYEQMRGPSQHLPLSIDVNLDQQPFWAALAAICSEAALSPNNNNNNAQISLRESSGPMPFGKRPQSVGTFSTTVVNSLSRNHSISLEGDDPQVTRACAINLTAYVDPRLRMVQYQTQPEIEKADDDAGNSIAAPQAGQPNSQESQCPWLTSGISIPLEYDPQVSHKLTTFKGTIKATAASESQTFEITDLANSKGTEKELAGIKLTIEDVKEQERAMEVHVMITRQEMPRENFRILYGRIFRDGRFVAADGRQTMPSGGGGGGEDKLQYTLNATYADDPEKKPVKLTWEITTRTEQIDLPFEFHDIPLP